MSDIEKTLMNISAKAWACTASVFMIVPDRENAERISNEFRAIQHMSDAALAKLRGGEQPEADVLTLMTAINTATALQNQVAK